MEKLFEYYIETEDFNFKYAKGEPSAKGKEFHDYNELVFFINGNSYFISKNIQQKLSIGSIVLIPKEHFHQFYISNPSGYVRCILGFRDITELQSLIYDIMDTPKVVAKPDKNIINTFENIIEIIKSNLSNEEKNLFIHSALTQLLIHFKMNTSGVISQNDNLSPVVSRALNIIDANYAENLTVKSLADQLYVSSSTLSHKFKTELNISVYQYILKKRLSAAHEYIRNGCSAATAASNSGFSDYSCFYRQYKKYYRE